jgi:hypothetical protein
VVSFTPSRFIPAERAPGSHRLGGSVGPKAGHAVAKRENPITAPAGNWTPGRPVRSIVPILAELFGSRNNYLHLAYFPLIDTGKRNQRLDPVADAPVTRIFTPEWRPVLFTVNPNKASYHLVNILTNLPQLHSAATSCALDLLLIAGSLSNNIRFHPSFTRIHKTLILGLPNDASSTAHVT